MKSLYLTLCGVLATVVAVAQTPTISPDFDSEKIRQTMRKQTNTNQPKVQETESSGTTMSFCDRITYGGNIGFTYIGEEYRLQIAPTVGFYITRDFSLGLQFVYDYYLYDRGDIGYSEQGIGGGAYTRYEIPIQPLRAIGSDVFVHAEYDFTRYRTHYKADESNRYRSQSEFLIGAGMYIPLGGKVRFSLVALWDLVRLTGNEVNNRYAATPTIRAGIVF